MKMSISSLEEQIETYSGEKQWDFHPASFMYKINPRGTGEQLGFLKNLMDEQITQN